MGTVSGWFGHCLTQLKKRLGQPQNHKPLNTGEQAERFVARYLQKKGLKLLARNYFTKAGEIDLIMQENSGLVFIEVKYRQQSDWAQAVETVTQQKQQRIIMAAKQYMQNQKVYDRINCRFDVVAVDGVNGTVNVNWIKHAFY